MTYRVLAVLLLCSCTADAPVATAPSDAPSAPAKAERAPVLHLSVPDAVTEGAGRYKADWSFDLRVTVDWSVHVHVIPPGQLVPLHRHPANEELALVLGGEGTWETVWVGEEQRSEVWALGFGEAVYSAAGAAHQVRNLGSEALATVVIQRPEFGQNWYLLADEVTSTVPSLQVGTVAPPMFPGWAVGWAGGQPASTLAQERLGFVVSGEGTLSFEDTTLPLTPGYFFKIPPGLEHVVDGEVRWLDVRVSP